MPEPKNEESAQRAQRKADEIVTNEDDDRRNKKRFEETGEPVRDALGNQDGAS